MNRKPQSTHAVIKRFTIGVFLSCSVAVSVKAAVNTVEWPTNIQITTLKIDKDRPTRDYIDCLRSRLNRVSFDKFCKQDASSNARTELPDVEYMHIGLSLINSSDPFVTYRFDVYANVTGEITPEFKKYMQGKPTCITNKIDDTCTSEAQKAVFKSDPVSKDIKGLKECIQKNNLHPLSTIAQNVDGYIYARGKENSKLYRDNKQEIHACITQIK